MCKCAQKKSYLIKFYMRKVQTELYRSNCNSAGVSAFLEVRHRRMKADDDMKVERLFFFPPNGLEFLTSTSVRKILASLNSFHVNFKIAFGQGACYFTKKYVSFVIKLGYQIIIFLPSHAQSIVHNDEIVPERW